MTIKQALSWSQQQLLAKQPTSYQLDAEIILAHCLQQTRVFILSHSEIELSSEQQSAFEAMIAKRQAHWPVAYLLGQQEFYGLNFIVNQDVLIPRPETELMVDSILASQEAINSQTTIIDIGTGSGCIIIALAKHLSHITSHFIGTDISEPALTVAKANAQTHQQNITFLTGSLLEPIVQQPELITNDLIITANLPYLDKDWETSLQFPDSAGLQYEPTVALTDQADGLLYYRQLAQQLTELLILKPDLRIKLYCEFNEGQALGLQAIFAQQTITIAKDLAGLDRLAIIKY
ncbi:MAG: peptide chain release factor N(5)-glutamine methyltransferase [bacterium]